MNQLNENRYFKITSMLFDLLLQVVVLLWPLQQQDLDRRIPMQVKKSFSTMSLQMRAGRMMGPRGSLPVHQMEFMHSHGPS